MLLGDFNANLGKENNFESTVKNESLYETSSDNVIRLANFATSECVGVKSTVFVDLKILLMERQSESTCLYR
jgi:hypothetical protein